MDNISVLPMRVEECLEKRKSDILKECGLEEAYPNPLLRDDVLELLDRFCTVVFFPLENEDNNGFHITDMPFYDGSRKHFVFINTAQTMEKQVFTAAHELGHVWRVDEYVINQLGLEDNEEIREMIINRFAATLLIPKEIFRKSFSAQVKELGNEDGTITVINMLRLIVILMNQFFVPMKAIVLRFVELGILSDETAEFLLGHKEVPENEIAEIIDDLISDYGFIKFQNPSNKKWIDGLAELLEAAECKQLVEQEKIDRMRELFDLKPPSSFTTDMNSVFPFVTQEG